MNEENVLRQRNRAGVERAAPGGPYTAKDFQLEVLDRLEEMQGLAEALEESWNKKLEAMREQRLLKFDSRAVIAMAAIALSIAGYVIEDARNSSRLDAEIEATKARVMRLEQIATTTTEARIRMEVQLGELRDGQGEIKALLEVREGGSKRVGSKQ